MAKSSGKPPESVPHLASWRRIILGILAVVLIICGLMGLYFRGDSQGALYVVSSAMWRVGLTLGTLWLAFPQLASFFRRWPPILVGGYAFGLLTIAMAPKSRVVILPAALILTFLHIFGYLLPKPDRRRDS